MRDIITNRWFWIGLITTTAIWILLGTNWMGFVRNAGATAPEPYKVICHHTPGNNVTLSFQNEQSYTGHLGTPHSQSTYDTDGECEEPSATPSPTPCPEDEVSPTPTNEPTPTDEPEVTPTEEPKPTDKPLDWDNRIHDENNCLNKNCNGVDTNGNEVVLPPAPFSK